MEVNLESAAHVLVFGLAVWLMMKPTSTVRIAVLSGFSMLEAILAMPIMPNHKMIFSWLILQFLGEYFYLASAEEELSLNGFPPLSPF